MLGHKRPRSLPGGAAGAAGDLTGAMRIALDAVAMPLPAETCCASQCKLKARGTDSVKPMLMACLFALLGAVAICALLPQRFSLSLLAFVPLSTILHVCGSDRCGHNSASPRRVWRVPCTHARRGIWRRIWGVRCERHGNMVRAFHVEGISSGEAVPFRLSSQDLAQLVNQLIYVAFLLPLILLF